MVTPRKSSSIDYVILWVTAEDSAWQQDYSKYKKISYSADKNQWVRFRDWNTLKYLFRGIESFSPWVRYVHLVTNGQKPHWLDLSNPKLRLVTHEQIFPDKAALPTFNSSAIQVCLQNIPDLSEQFVLFDDDQLILGPTSPEFFFKRGKPCDQYVLMNSDNIECPIWRDSLIETSHRIWNKLGTFNVPALLKRDYKLKTAFRNLAHYLVTKNKIIAPNHYPQPLLKSTLFSVNECFGEEVAKTFFSRFRAPSDLNVYSYRYWQLVTGQFFSVNINFSKSVCVSHKAHIMAKNVDELFSSGAKLGHVTDIDFDKFYLEDNFEEIKKTLEINLDQYLPEKSSFERE